MSAVFLFEQVLACTESATSEYTTMSQCLSALLGRPRRVKFVRRNVTLITVTVICTLSLLESLQLAYNHEGMEYPSCETLCALRQLSRSTAGMSFSQSRLPSPIGVLPRL